MTKKHFRALAEAMNDLLIQLQYELRQKQQGDIASLKIWEETVETIANVCEANNPRFDRAKFIKACEEGL